MIFLLCCQNNSNNGNNTALMQVNDTYADLGATITGPTTNASSTAQ